MTAKLNVQNVLKYDQKTLKYYHTACEGKPTINKRRHFITSKHKEKQNKQVDLIEISNIDDSVKS